MIKKLHFKVLLLMATLVFGVGNVWGADTYTLVKSAAELSEGDVILITSSKTNGTVVGGLMGAPATKNCPGVDVTISDEKITSLGEGQEITLETKNASGYFNMKVGDAAYLYAANSSSGTNNYLKTKNSNSIYWSIEINSSTYAATIKDMVSSCNNRNWLRYNSSSSLFSCYGSGQADVYVFKKVVAPAHTITAISSNDAWGTVLLEGTTITATPKTGYRVKAGNDGYTVTAGTATVVNNGNNTFTVTPSSDCTVQINFEAIPKHEANFSVNGVEVSSSEVEEGADIVFPAEDPADLGGKKFVGWAAAPISGTTDEEPTFVSSAVMRTDNVTYYAVFATAADGGAATATLTANSSWSSYQDKEFTDDKGNTWTANCAGQNQSGTYCYGLNGGTSYLSSPVFPGNVTAVKVTAYNGASKTRTFTLKKGDTEVGTISVAPSAAGDELTASLNGTAFNQFDMTSSAALQFHTIAVTYSVVSYSAYCTSVTVPLEITAAGFATYCSAYALNFKGTGLTAYQAGMNGKTVEFTEVDDVPAGTGVLVKGAEGTYNVPVVASSNTDVRFNKLVGVTEVTEIHGTEAGIDTYYYVLKKNTPAGVGFYRVTAANYNVRANSAYLALAKSIVGSAKGFIPVDGTTAIDLVDTANEVAAPAYNLQGQRVSNGYKGVVIVNGKKYMK